MEQARGIANTLLVSMNPGTEHVLSWPVPGAGRRPKY